jgi:transcriptional regulator with XRE-family HTH domain
MQPDKLQVSFGKRVRSLRRSNDFTQEQLAATIGCSTEYISRIERGLASPSFEILSALANAGRAVRAIEIAATTTQSLPSQTGKLWEVSRF